MDWEMGLPGHPASGLYMKKEPQQAPILCRYSKKDCIVTQRVKPRTYACRSLMSSPSLPSLPAHSPEYFSLGGRQMDGIIKSRTVTSKTRRTDGVYHRFLYSGNRMCYIDPGNKQGRRPERKKT